MDNSSISVNTDTKGLTLDRYVQLIDQQLGRLYGNTDAIDNYGHYFDRSRQSGRQHYRCLQTNCLFHTNKSSIAVRHIRRHLNQKPYKCWLKGCDQYFYQKCDLRVHLIRHLDDRPFKCNQTNCQNTYTSQKALSLHLKRHDTTNGSSDQLFVCDVTDDCRKRFVVKWELNKHIRDKHQPKHDVQTVTTEATSSTGSATTGAHCFGGNASKLIGKKANRRPIDLIADSLVVSKADRQLKRQLMSDLSGKSAKFGFEEVIQYVINECPKSAETLESIDNSLNDIDMSLEALNVKTESLLSEQKLSDQLDVCCPSRLMTNELFVKLVDTIESFIEIQKITDEDGDEESANRFVYKWFNTGYTSDTIDGIVGHVSQHIANQMTESLRNKYPINYSIGNEFAIQLN